MNKSLVIVESPAKARTIAGYLGSAYVVESSIGHIRDLPVGAGDVPAQHKEAYAKDVIGVDTENGFRPLYLIDPDKKQHIQKLKKLLKEADELLLATDEDREGESIAWHLIEVLDPKVPVRRMVFHEITKKAIQEAIENPRPIDRRLVDAQEARRILDRIYGYTVSPVLWHKVRRGLSAGRVQSVATRIVVERERARIDFRKAEYWDVDGLFDKQGGDGELSARLTSIDKKRIASGKDFDQSGRLKGDSVRVLDATSAKKLAEGMKSAAFTVASVERKPYRRRPAAPFMTSTIQQEASRKLRFSAKRTMRTAQRLYESGYITYMRTDSTTLSELALGAARSQIAALYGAEYVPPAPRSYANKVKNAQEAHEAIRPAGDEWKTPEQVAKEIGGDEARLYELVWMRTIASQMEDARGETVSVRIAGRVGSEDLELSVSGRTITFPGFLRAYVEGSDDPDAELEEKEKILPPLLEGERLVNKDFIPQAHETQPPARFTEASLVRALEELGVGRPSTYAAILSTIIDREYVWKKSNALVPSFLAFAVVTLLEKHFTHLVDYSFTARMEDELDSIASGDETAEPWLRRFWFGGGEHGTSESDIAARVGLKSMIETKLDDIDARAINRLPLGKDPAGNPIVLRVGRRAPFLEREREGAEEKEYADIPDGMTPDELTLERALELLEAPKDRTLGNHPTTGESITVRNGRFGPYVQLGEAEADAKEKPKRESLLKTMTIESITLEDALLLLSLPRRLGEQDGETIDVFNGKYGPYVKKGKETRSLAGEEQLFTLNLEQANALLAQPKQRGQRRTVEPLKTFGADPVSGVPITVREGRFGPYVSDGTTHASLRKGDTIESITEERAVELLAERRGRPSTGRKKAAKKTTKKAAKKTTKKAAKKASDSETEKPAKKAKKKSAKKTGKKASKKTAKKAAAESVDDDGTSEPTSVALHADDAPA